MNNKLKKNSFDHRTWGHQTDGKEYIFSIGANTGYTIRNKVASVCLSKSLHSIFNSVDFFYIHHHRHPLGHCLHAYALH